MIQLIKIITATVFAVLSLNSFAETKIKPSKIEKASIMVNTYIETTTLGKTAYSKYIFANNFQQQINGSKITTLNKDQLVKSLKSQEGYVQNCETKYQIVEANEDYSIAKVEMKYSNFTRTDYLTMTSANGTWQIKQIHTSYSN